MKAPKYNLRGGEAWSVIFEKQLEKFGVTRKTMVEKVGDVEWFSYYTFTPEEEQTFKQWFVNFLIQQCHPKLTLRAAVKEYDWFALGYGLKVIAETSDVCQSSPR